MIKIENKEKCKVATFNNKIYRKYEYDKYYKTKNNEYLHRDVYCYYNNMEMIPKGYAIHHIDHNHDNNNIENLQMLTRGEHAALHNIKRTGIKYKKGGKLK